jgi:hypothetical protein
VFLCPTDFAILAGVTRQAVCKWLRLERIPGAVRHPGNRWYWQIPESTLNDYRAGILPLPPEGSRVRACSRPS